VRNILRRVFALLHNKGWWEQLGMDGLLELFQYHKEDLATIYGPFKEYKSFRPIIELEYDRWLHTDGAQAEKLEKLVQKKKGVPLTLDDWIICVSSWGVPADQVAKITKQPVPLNLYYEIASRQEKMVRATPAQLYATAHLPETKSLYYTDHKAYDFQGKILEVMLNVVDHSKPNIVVLDQSSFYPTSGGQEHDDGQMWIDGAEYEVVDVLKVGPCVLHVLNPPLPSAANYDSYKGREVRGLVNVERRSQLRNNHTATHIVYASCRKVLGPHVWQAGAHKNVHQAHLDITHFRSLSHADMLAIENEANRIVMRCLDITKGFMAKDVAEAQYGFHLYQGGVVPGNELRVVNIADTDTEACCGTHSDNTAEVGMIKLIKSARISDGIVRLYYVAGENALALANVDSHILNGLTSSWGIAADDILPTATRFFDGYKKYANLVQKQNTQILDLSMKVFLLEPETKLTCFESSESNATMFIGNMPPFAAVSYDATRARITRRSCTFYAPVLHVLRQSDDFITFFSEPSNRAEEITIYTCITI
jgi:alanyl-tRNA synthetase